MALLHEARLFTTEVSDHPFGIGVFGFTDLFMRDTTVATSFELEDEDLLLTFVPHNEALTVIPPRLADVFWISLRLSD